MCRECYFEAKGKMRGKVRREEGRKGRGGRDRGERKKECERRNEWKE